MKSMPLPSQLQPCDGHPQWVQAALRGLEDDYASACRGPEGARLKARVVAVGGDPGEAISPHHRRLLAKAWMSVGPSVTAPPIERLPGVLHFLKRLGMQDPLLESWLLGLCGEHLARRGWPPPGGAMCGIARTQTRRMLCQYWEWLLIAIASRAGLSVAAPLAIEARITASRVIVLLYGPHGMYALLRRLRAWETARSHGDFVEFASFATAPPGAVYPPSPERAR